MMIKRRSNEYCISEKVVADTYKIQVWNMTFVLDKFQLPWVVVWGLHFLKRSGKSHGASINFESCVNKEGLTTHLGLIFRDQSLSEEHLRQSISPRNVLKESQRFLTNQHCYFFG